MKTGSTTTVTTIRQKDAVVDLKNMTVQQILENITSMQWFSDNLSRTTVDPHKLSQLLADIINGKV